MVKSIGKPGKIEAMTTERRFNFYQAELIPKPKRTLYKYKELCPRCGSKMIPNPLTRSMMCPRCGYGR